MNKFLGFFILTFGCASLHAQLFSVSPSIGFSKSLPFIKSVNANSLGRLKPNDIRNGLALGASINYNLGQQNQLVFGYNKLECGYGWRITPIGGKYTSVGGFVGNKLNQMFFGYSHGFNLLFQSKIDKQEKKNGWNYDNGNKWLRMNLGLGPSISFMNTPESKLSNNFGAVPSYNNDNPEEVWMLGYETPRYVHKTSMGLWFRTGLTFVKKGKDKLSLDFVMNLGLQDKYIIETNNQFGNTRTGQLIREEQFNVVSRGTSMALMLSYPIYFGKKK